MRLHQRFLFAVILIGAFAASVAVTSFVLTPNADEQQFCTADALLVDGRTYGRSGPECHFYDEAGNLLAE